MADTQPSAEAGLSAVAEAKKYLVLAMDDALRQRDQSCRLRMDTARHWMSVAEHELSLLQMRDEALRNSALTFARLINPEVK